MAEIRKQLGEAEANLAHRLTRLAEAEQQLEMARVEEEKEKKKEARKDKGCEFSAPPITRAQLVSLLTTAASLGEEIHSSTRQGLKLLEKALSVQSGGVTPPRSPPRTPPRQRPPREETKLGSDDETPVPVPMQTHTKPARQASPIQHTGAKRTRHRSPDKEEESTPGQSAPEFLPPVQPIPVQRGVKVHFLDEEDGPEDVEEEPDLEDIAEESCVEEELQELPPKPEKGQTSLHSFMSQKPGTLSGTKTTRARLKEVGMAHSEGKERPRSRSPVSSSPSESGIGFQQDEPWSATDSELGFRQPVWANSTPT